MAYSNKIINNPVTGQQIRFILTGKETNGELLEMESTWRPYSIRPVLHYHPVQQEDFTVIAGELTVRINDTIKVLHSGDTLRIMANEPHAMWNDSHQPAVVNWKVRPAKETEQLLEIGMGLANSGKVNERGMPPFMQSVVIANRFDNVIRLAKPPYIIQKIVFVVLAPFAWLLGYRAINKDYID